MFLISIILSLVLSLSLLLFPPASHTVRSLSSERWRGVEERNTKMTLGSATRRGKKTKIEETCPPFEPFESPFGCCYVLEENKRVKKKRKRKKKRKTERAPRGKKSGEYFFNVYKEILSFSS